MTVKRIVANLATDRVPEMAEFYRRLFDLDPIMDHGWIMTLGSGAVATVQISVASQGGSDTSVPDLSIEVDDVDAIYRRAKDLGHEIAYTLTDEPWGVRRFYLRDPGGKLLNILSHS